MLTCPDWCVCSCLLPPANTKSLSRGSRGDILHQRSRKHGVKLLWRQNCKIARSKLGSTLTTGIRFSRSAGTSEVDGVWTSDFKWISTEPTMLTPRRTVESLQASLEALVFHCSKPCPGFGESPSFSKVYYLCLSKTAFVDVQAAFLH